MPRQIKFRAKRKDNGQWVECESLIQGVIDGRKFVQLEHTDSSEFRQYEVIPETVGQFVGMFDNNGRHVYEGDFVKITVGGIEYTGIVVFGKKTLGFGVHVKYHFNGWADGHVPKIYKDKFYRINNTCEVIGNIFDNPELLKSEQ